MDGRKADRNADKISQIYFQITQFEKKNHNKEAAELAMNLKHHLEQALIFNDHLGEMAMKGLI